MTKDGSASSSMLGVENKSPVFSHLKYQGKKVGSLVRVGTGWFFASANINGKIMRARAHNPTLCLRRLREQI